MKKASAFLLLFVFTLTVLVGCGKESSPTIQFTETLPQQNQPSTAAEAAPPALNSKPGSLGVHVVSTAQIEAGPEVLDGVTMTMPEGLTRQTVSNVQHDFIKDGTQVGGVLLVDIPADMLQKTVDTYEGTEELADYLAKQVMADADPSKITFSGGGKSPLFDGYIFLTYYDFNTNYAYTHHIYVGENYCYDIWFDDVYHPDGGELINSTISSEDIKPELNDPDYGWTFVNGELVTK